jgi:hypothetical protein
MCHFLRQTSPEMDSAFRHGEAPWQERELRTLAPLTLEVERNRNARLMAGHLLGVLEPSVVLQINRDTGSSPGVVPVQSARPVISVQSELRL